MVLKLCHPTPASNERNAIDGTSALLPKKHLASLPSYFPLCNLNTTSTTITMQATDIELEVLP
jgi:hypothetical protein